MTRTTAETLISIFARADQSLRLAAPFITESGLALLEDSLVAATNRGVSIEILLSDREALEASVLSGLLGAVRERGDRSRVSLAVMREDGPWSHMKVVVADGRICYIGSANLTGAGLGLRNLELGVILLGERVADVDEILDLFLAEATDERFEV